VSYVAHHSVTPDELSGLITSVGQSLGGLGKAATPEEARTPAVPVRGSVRRDYVECLECGFLAGLYRAEREIAEKLKVLAAGKPSWPVIDADKATHG
jgi:hypothetical protein